MKYRISDKFLKRKKLEPIFSSLWGLLIGCLVLAANEPTPWQVATGAILFMLVLTGGSSWLGSKRIIESFKDHCLELKGSTLIVTEKAMCYEIELNSIHRIVFNKTKDKFVSIIIERVKGQKEKLPPYEDLNGLAENLIKVIPPEKVKVRRWLHL